MSAAGTRLYLISPPGIELAAFADQLAAALDAGDVPAFQLRLKDIDDLALRQAIDRLRPIVQARGTAFILNDRPDLARVTGCDGVHVGQSDMAVRDARKLIGPDLMLGVTCHGSRHLALEAGEAGADYVAFGAFFPTATKTIEHQADIDIIAWWSEMMEIPAVAIGGIDASNCAPLVQAGADFLAVVSAVWSHPAGAAAGVKSMQASIMAAARGRSPE
ncbi:MAG: thiamine-phosphate diphosphorylase [Rhodospirillales bacterium 20-60-12]|nr:MAG: thiamine-phosphate diphosphorylase [Rhodospirillales bacterium 20-60-12]HQT67549.1 thiamine phosphate synthase [Acetobacteraceae bacterium]